MKRDPAKESSAMLRTGWGERPNASIPFAGRIVAQKLAGQYVVADAVTAQNAGMTDIIAENLQQVRAEIAAACARSGRSSRDMTLIAVTKYAEWPWIRRLIELGHHDLGENRPQQLVARAEQLSGDVRWHLIGHLQRNKAKSILSLVAMIHAVDSLRLLECLSSLAVGMPSRPRVLLEVNVSGEAAKDGFANSELLSQWDSLQALPSVEIAGLMTMAPLTDDPETVRPVFRRLRELRDELQSRAADHVRLTELSMGMSGDFAVAIEEGATLVRIGSRLFQGLQTGVSA